MELSISVYQEFLAIWKGQLSITHADVLPHLSGSPNMHFYASDQTTSPPGNQYFIKVTKNEQAYQREGSVLSIIASKVDFDMHLVAEGVHDKGYYWRAFCWIHCDAVHPETPEEYREIGRTLGRMHSGTTPASFPGIRPLSLGRSLAQEVENLQRVSVDLGKYFTRPIQWLLSYESAWVAYEQTLPQVLLHRDFGWRNLIRKETGELMIVDYEHVALGPCYLDLTKCLDRELCQPEHLHFFEQGYAEVTHVVFDHVPVDYSWGTRLWGAARFFYHGTTQDDQTSIEHGFTIVERLRKEWRRVSEAND